MQIGADAVVEMAAPAPARAPDGAQASSDERSFDDHLDAAAAPGRTEPESRQLENADADDAPSGDEPDGALAGAASALPPLPLPAQPALIQIFASFVAATPTPSTAATPTPQDPESAPPATTGVPAAPQNPESAPPTTTGVAADAPAAPPAAPTKSAHGDKANPDGQANAPMPTQSGDEGMQTTSPSTDNAQAAQAPPQSSTPPVVDGTAAAQTAAPELALLPAPTPPPPANADTRRTKLGDAAKIPIAPANAGVADANSSASASTKPNAQGKAALAPAASHTAPPRENFALLLAQHEAPQPVSTLPAPTSGLTAAHAAPVSASTDQVGQIAPAVVQVSREIVRRFSGESTRFELRLDPPELGRVEVRLEVSRDHRVTATVGADSPQALAELTRHARDLEQALQSAGLELSEGGLSFDLSERSHNQEDADPTDNRAARDDAEANPETSAAQRPARPLGLQSWRGIRVDLVA